MATSVTTTVVTGLELCYYDADWDGGPLEEKGGGGMGDENTFAIACGVGGISHLDQPAQTIKWFEGWRGVCLH